MRSGAPTSAYVSIRQHTPETYAGVCGAEHLELVVCEVERLEEGTEAEGRGSGEAVAVEVQLPEERCAIYIQEYEDTGV